MFPELPWTYLDVTSFLLSILGIAFQSPAKMHGTNHRSRCLYQTKLLSHNYTNRKCIFLRPLSKSQLMNSFPLAIKKIECPRAKCPALRRNSFSKQGLANGKCITVRTGIWFLMNITVLSEVIINTFKNSSSNSNIIFSSSNICCNRSSNDNYNNNDSNNNNGNNSRSRRNNTSNNTNF